MRNAIAPFFDYSSKGWVIAEVEIVQGNQQHMHLDKSLYETSLVVGEVVLRGFSRFWTLIMATTQALFNDSFKINLIRTPLGPYFKNASFYRHLFY